MRIISVPWKRQRICLPQTSQASQADDHATATVPPLGSPRGQDSHTPYSAEQIDLGHLAFGGASSGSTQKVLN